MNAKKSVYIPIEIKRREFVSQIFLACELVARGYFVFIGSHAAIFSLLESNPNKGGVYLDKGTQTMSRSRFIQSKVDKMMILDQELSPNISPSKYPQVDNIVASRFYPGTEEFVDAFFTISEPHTSAARKIIKKNLVIESGWPRFEFLSKKSAAFYDSKIPKIMKKYKTFVLFPSNLSVVANIEAAVKSTSDSFTGPLGLTRKDLELEVEKAKELAKLFLAWRSVGYKDAIVVRPHLMESVRTWRKIMKKIPGVHVVRRNEIFPWLSAASSVIHFGSTSAIQASLLNKPVFFIEELAGNYPSGSTVLISDGLVNVGHHPNNPKRCCDSMTKDNLIRKYQSENSTRIIADQILSVQDETKPISHSRFRLLKRNFTSRGIRRCFGLARDELLAITGYLPVNSQLQNLPLGINKIETVRAIKRVSPMFDIAVKQFGINLVLLHSRKQ